MAMIKRRGAREWENIHFTHKTQLKELIDVDFVIPQGPAQPHPFDYLRNTAAELESLAQEARQAGTRIRALGSGWALTDIAITDGWLVNTKQLNGCFDVSDKYFETGYDAAKRDFVVVSQCGTSIAELNAYLEEKPRNGIRRALKTAGIGAGQTIAGAISGCTHGSAVRFGAIQDYVVGLNIILGSGKSIWLERDSYPVLNDLFIQKLGAEILRDDEIFNSALVSFGSFGFIAAVAIETEPIYHLDFAPVRTVGPDELDQALQHIAQVDPNDTTAPYHFEFIYNPYDLNKTMVATALKRDWEADHPTPKPVWIIRDEDGLAPGIQSPSLFLKLPVPAKWKAAFQFKQYRSNGILDNVRGTPGQLFTATITYMEGYTESALGISINDAMRMREITADVIKNLKIPCISQVRIVHPTDALFGFTIHTPKTAVFEFGLLNDAKFPVFEKALTDAMTAAGIDYTFHWSKNSGINAETLRRMYGDLSLANWLEARKRLFEGDADLMRVYENEHLRRAGLV
jgi:FAD binding domain